MLSLCVAVTAYLCIADPYRPASQRLSIFKFDRDVIPAKADADAVNRLGIELSIVASDVVEYRPLRGFKQVCAGKNCIYYRKICDHVAMQCGYAYGQPFKSENEPNSPIHFMPEDFSIRYHSTSALKTAEAKIYLTVGPKTDPSYISLSQLEEGAILGPLQCPPRRSEEKNPGVVESGC